MSDVKAKSRQEADAPRSDIAWLPDQEPRRPRHALWRILGVLITVVAVGTAVWFGRAMWQAYMLSPWTRDGTVRAYVVTIASEVSGRIVDLPVKDNQLVKKNDMLMVIDPTNYSIALKLNQAAVQQAQVNMQNAQREATRREELPSLAVTVEQQQTYETQAVAAQAQYEQAVANLNQAQVNVQRTVIRSPVNGWVTNLLTQAGDYATEGENVISVVDSDSFWVDAYFEETNLAPIHVGDPATIRLMGYPQDLHGHVSGITRAISVSNAQPNGQGVAVVNPIFTWVRLAQRVPVRIQFDHVPQNVQLVAGMTATVQVNPTTSKPPK